MLWPGVSTPKADLTQGALSAPPWPNIGQARGAGSWELHPGPPGPQVPALTGPRHGHESKVCHCVNEAPEPALSSLMKSRPLQTGTNPSATWLAYLGW